MSTNPGIQKRGYEDTLRALGAEIDRLRLTEIVVVEVPQGLFLKGQSFVNARGGFRLEPRSGFIANDDVEELAAAAREQREPRHRWPWERA